MRTLLFHVFLCLGIAASAQKSCYHLFCYTVPVGWEMEENKSFVNYTYQNATKGQWARFSLYAEAPGKVDTTDFRMEWDELVWKAFTVKDKNVKSTLAVKKGWKIRRGKSSFVYNGQAATAMLYTVSGQSLRASIVATTNDKALFPVIEKFLAGVVINPDFKAPVKIDQLTTSNIGVASSSGFTFTSINFDDGWFAEAKADYVEVTKGDMKVLIHYADARTNIAGDPDPLINNAWNVLVAPKYNSLKNFVTRSPSIDYYRPYFGAGEVTNASGKSLYVAVFSRRNTGWMEFITKSKQAFIAEFGVDADKIDWSTSGGVWAKMENMATYNRFAIGASDLKGSWTSDFGGMQEYYNIYTGSQMATSIHQSSETFSFLSGNKYNWSILAINGPAGAMRYDQAKNAGTFSLPNNWQLQFSNLEGKPRTYDAYFSCVKGGRMLWLQDAKYKNGWKVYGIKKP